MQVWVQWCQGRARDSAFLTLLRGADGAGPQFSLGVEHRLSLFLKGMETELQRGRLDCLRSHSLVETGPRLESRSPAWPYVFLSFKEKLSSCLQSP